MVQITLTWRGVAGPSLRTSSSNESKGSLEPTAPPVHGDLARGISIQGADEHPGVRDAVGVVLVAVDPKGDARGPPVHGVLITLTVGGGRAIGWLDAGVIDAHLDPALIRAPLGRALGRRGRTRRLAGASSIETRQGASVHANGRLGPSRRARARPLDPIRGQPGRRKA